MDAWNKVSDISDNADGRYNIERTVTKKGITFTTGDQYTAKSAYKDFPRTFEAWVNLPSGASGARMILSDMVSGQVCSCFGLNDASAGVMNLYLRDNDGTQYRFIFNAESSKIEKDTWTHIAATIGTDTVKFYKDGKLVQTLDNTNPTKAGETGTMTGLNTAISSKKFTFINTPTVGGDHRNGNTAYWTGSISSVAVYSDERTADEIYDDMASCGTDGLMLKYDLGAWDGDSIISDGVNGDYDIQLLWISPEDMPRRDPNSYAFSIAVVGDTQYLAEYDANNGTTKLESLYQWIVDNKTANKTKLVMGLGDIVDDVYVQKQWEVAKKAFKVMEDGNLAYTLVPGNHDHAKPGADGSGISYFSDKGYDYHITYDNYGHLVDGHHTETITNQYYVDENNNRSEKEFTTTATMRNTYKLIEIGDLSYLILNLDYSPSDAALEWANEVVASHPNHKVIVNTHCYLAISGNELVDSAATGNLKADGTSGWHNPIKAGDAKDGNEGPEIWNKLIKKYANIEYVFCGHEPSNDILRYEQTGENGNTVTTMLIDPQYFDRDTDASGCVGMVAMLYFSNDGRTIDVEYYSTVKNAYYNTLNQFRLGEKTFADIEIYEYAVTENVISTTVYAVNESGAAKTGILVAGLYCDDVLLEAQSMPISVETKAAKEIPIKFGAHGDKSGEFTIKAFWWNGLNKIVPQSSVENSSVNK